ncbi:MULTISPECIES: IclR family transcriptional regulator [Streptomyces]|uniref:IclR family transcriptional regulator n=1 Tax=Streptomyces doudnae TaxID=3075536 RepID=A0ABD5EXZ2_9ACTN|nr:MULTISPECIES: IclR family transcriptional regulator [unclassified Streptomyces]MDT0439491.1 IclR family transcriptional regulator [Streptomyces sp. DSM 41981]MYQ69275.1 helix-turn-helix domain-containing protein [Streptomyces sp. SID4950]SCE52601.1 transcriptional regulator, IclR family [Streptomyces sp. SolWspMP-5a-2]
MAEKGDDARSSGDIQAVDRTAQILRLFGPETPELTAGEAAERLGLNRTTTYRYCTSLVASGLLERGSAPGSYAPGALLLQLGAFALGRRKVVDLAPSYMRELCSTTGLTTVLSLWGSTGPIVSRVEEDATRTVLVTVRVGTQLSLTAAQSKVFLAHMSDQLRADRLLGSLPAVAREELTEEIRTLAGTDQVAMSPDGFGIHAMAAPVFDEYGICATVALVATDDLLPLDVHGATARHLRNTARALSQAMGGDKDA